jgi:hypothetical protein
MMSLGKHMSLPEARKKKDFDHFGKEHPSEGTSKPFDSLVKGFTKATELTAKISRRKRPSGN